MRGIGANAPACVREVRGGVAGALVVTLCCAGCSTLNPEFDGAAGAGDTDGGTSGASGSSDGDSGPPTTGGAGTGDAGDATSGTTGGVDDGGATSDTGGVPCGVDDDCDDSDPCTQDTCVGGSCRWGLVGSDEDGDGVGDACDVCGIPGFDDDLADYDGDGVPCREDACLFDGPSPPSLPSMAGPAEELSLVNIDLDQTGETVVIVEPDAPIRVTFDYDIASCGCPGCLVQGAIGFYGDTVGPCFYEGTPGCQGDAGMADQQVTAPTAPGMYWLVFRRDWEASCATNKPFDPQQVFAAVCVQ